LSTHEPERHFLGAPPDGGALERWQRELPPGTMLARWTATRTFEVRLVVHVDVVNHPVKWYELRITTLGAAGVQVIELADEDFVKRWKRLA